MPRRLTNLLLLGFVLGLVASGLLGWVLPVEIALPVYVAHRALALALVISLAWKVGLARRSLVRRLPRVDASLAVGVVTAIIFAASLALGFAWTLGFVSFAALFGYSPLNVHVFLGLGLVPLVLLHLAWRWERRPSLGRLLTRRAALRLLGLSAATLVALPLLDRVAEASGLRRVTGSKHAGSFTGNAMPVTIWALDGVPALDARTWRLEVGELSLSYDELAALPQSEASAVLDCTGGWWSEQRWSGVRVGDVLDRAGARGEAATVVSMTGHRWTFPTHELREALLATHVGGEALAPGHGYPVRLVVPGRRGFQWIKWVARIELA